MWFSTAVWVCIISQFCRKWNYAANHARGTVQAYIKCACAKGDHYSWKCMVQIQSLWADRLITCKLHYWCLFMSHQCARTTLKHFYSEIKPLHWPKHFFDSFIRLEIKKSLNTAAVSHDFLHRLIIEALVLLGCCDSAPWLAANPPFVLHLFLLSKDAALSLSVGEINPPEEFRKSADLRSCRSCCPWSSTECTPSKLISVFAAMTDQKLLIFPAETMFADQSDFDYGKI